MEMIDVLKKLQEIAETKPELVKDAVENVEKIRIRVFSNRRSSGETIGGNRT